MEVVGPGYHIHLVCIHGHTQAPRYLVSWTNVAAAVLNGQSIPAEVEEGRLAVVVVAEEVEVEVEVVMTTIDDVPADTTTTTEVVVEAEDVTTTGIGTTIGDMNAVVATNVGVAAAAAVTMTDGTKASISPCFFRSTIRCLCLASLIACSCDGLAQTKKVWFT